MKGGGGEGPAAANGLTLSYEQSFVKLWLMKAKETTNHRQSQQSAAAEEHKSSGKFPEEIHWRLEASGLGRGLVTLSARTALVLFVLLQRQETGSGRLVVCAPF